MIWTHIPTPDKVNFKIKYMKHVDLHLGAAVVRPYRKVVIGKKNFIAVLLDVAIFALFVLTCYMMYNAIVWSIWS